MNNADVQPVSPNGDDELDKFIERWELGPTFENTNGIGRVELKALIAQREQVAVQRFAEKLKAEVFTATAGSHGEIAIVEAHHIDRLTPRKETT